jgi:hypothetical protein
MSRVRTEDYNLLVTIGYDDAQVEEVPCKIYLPVKASESVSVHLYPSQEQAQKMLKESPLFSIVGTEFGPRNVAFADIVIKEALRIDIQRDYKAESRIDYLFVVDPMDLKVTDYLPARSTTSTTKGSFKLTPFGRLHPWRSPILSEKEGEQTKIIQQTKIIRQISVRLPNDVNLLFDTQKRKRENEDEETVIFTELVANFEFDGEDIEGSRINETLHHLDDYLLLASFAARKRCICVSWEAWAGKTFTRFYRKRYVPPSLRRDERDDSLIDMFLLEEFMNVAYSNFVKADWQNLLRRAINYTLPLPQENRTIESSFVTLYSALETTVLYFRRNQSLETILSEDEWNVLANSLRDWLKTYERLKNRKDLRTLIYEKLPELNRVSFSSAFKEFCAHYGVDLQDLWNVVGRSLGTPLSEIRNRLVHGDDFLHDQYGVLISATDHLRWTVERMILAVLGWDPARSEVSTEKLSSQIAGRDDWQLARQKLTPY